MSSNNKITFTLTGNFQYDLGILGLKRVWDFFDIEYDNINNYSISVKRDIYKILEDIIAKIIIDNGIEYFYNKVLNELYKKNKNEKINIDIKLGDVKKIYKKKGLYGIIDYISNNIYNVINNKTKIDFNKIKNIVWQKGVNLLNNIFLNFQADMKVKGETVLEKVKNKLKSDIIKDSKCSFCYQRPGKRLSRDVFFFAPSQYNAFWFNEPAFFICPECLVSNMAITQYFTFLGNKLDAIVCYIPNIEDMEKLNDSLKNFFNNINNNYILGAVIKPLIEYEKIVLKQEASIKEIQILSFNLDSKEPSMEMFLFSRNAIMNLLKIENEIEALFSKDAINMLFGFVRKGDKYIKVDLSKDLLRTITENTRIWDLVQRYSRYCIMSEYFKQNQFKKPPPVKNFHARLFLDFIKIHFKLKGGEKNMIREFENFFDLGQRIRQRIFMILTDDKTKPINWNTFDNKIISLSNSFLNISRASLQQFQELLARTIISLHLNTNIDVIKSINIDNYSEIATTIALSILVKQPDESRTDEKNNNVESKNVEEI